jgi:uncharacterized surface protein with fasciclin (FAS1) repeats
MTNFHINKTSLKYKFVFLFIFLACFLLDSCQQEPKLWEVKSTEQVAIDYIESHEEYSEFFKLVEITGLHALLGIRGPYTIMLPDNDAMFAYYKEKGVNSITDFDDAFRRQLMLNHLITNEINTSDMGLGAIRDTNAIGDFLVTEFEGPDIILNRRSKIIKRDIRLANGYAHRIDRVIEPVTKDIFTILSENQSFKIFTESLRATGLNDTLQQINFPYGNNTCRNRYTLLAIPDSIFEKKGIYSVADLIKWTGGNADSVAYKSDEFYQYLDYHCLAGTHYLSHLESKLYPIMSNENYVLMTIDTDYKINLHPKTRKYTAFIVPASNTPAKNGALHVINDLLPVSEPAPQTVLFECTDFFDIRQGDWYGKYYMKWSDGKNSLAKIKFEGDFLGYYFKLNHGLGYLMNFDGLFMLNYWWIEVTFPRVIKGQYDVIYGSPWNGGTELADFVTEIDGVPTGIIYNKEKGLNQKIATVDFKTTSEHKIKLRAISCGALYWDYIQFVPVK